MTKLLELNDLTFSFGEKEVFSKLNFSIDENKINVLLGANASGKTTLLKLINKKYSNSFLLFFKENFKNKNNTVKHEIIYKSKKRVLFNEDIEKFNNLCYEFDINSILNEKIKNISLLDKVKVCLIASIMSDKALILLDDIFNMLDYENYVYISKVLNKVLKKNNITILYTTYKLDCCSKSNIINFLNNKKIELRCSFNKILEHDTLLSRNGILISTMLDLSLKLEFYNLLDEVIMDPDRMVDKLWR